VPSSVHVDGKRDSPKGSVVWVADASILKSESVVVIVHIHRRWESKREREKEKERERERERGARDRGKYAERGDRKETRRESECGEWRRGREGRRFPPVENVFIYGRGRPPEGTMKW